MKKFVVFNLPAHWHINPSLSVIQELVERWNQVTYFGEEEFKSKIVATWATYREYNKLPNIKNIEHNVLLNNYYFLIYRLLWKTYLSCDYLLNEVKVINPDYIIFDSLCFWWKCISEILWIKSISLNTVYLFNLKRILLLSLPKDIITFNFLKLSYFFKWNVLHNMIIKKYWIKKEGLLDRFLNKWDLNFVFTSEQFQDNYETYKAMDYKYVWPSILDRGEEYDDIDYSKLTWKVIYISLWTITNNEIDFYKDCIKNLQNYQWTVVISVWKKINIDSLWEIPDNFIIKNYINQLQILKYTYVFISHGWMNSVQEWLYNAVPLVLSPRHLEQNMIWRQVYKLWCGLVVEKYSSKQIFFSLNKILDNYNFYKNNCILISQTFNNAWWYKKVVDIIEENFHQNK